MLWQNYKINYINCNNKMVQTILLFYNGKCQWFKYTEQLSPDRYRDENWTTIFFQSVLIEILLAKFIH